MAHPPRIAINGPDAAGKTTLADELAVVLREGGREVIRASVDGFHRPRVERYRQGPDSPGGYYEDTFDYDALRTLLLDPLGPDGSREYRTAAFGFRADKAVVDPPERASERSAAARRWRLPSPTPASRGLGLHHLRLSELRRDASSSSASRDLELFGTAPDEVERRYRVRYIPGQELYFAEARPDETADTIVVNEDPAAPEPVCGPQPASSDIAELAASECLVPPLLSEHAPAAARQDNARRCSATASGGSSLVLRVLARGREGLRLQGRRNRTRRRQQGEAPVLRQAGCTCRRAWRRR